MVAKKLLTFGVVNAVEDSANVSDWHVHRPQQSNDSTCSGLARVVVAIPRTRTPFGGEELESGAGRLLSPSVSVNFTETGERFDGPNFLAMNEAYPEGWSIEVIETVTDGNRVAAQVRVTHGDEILWCAGFYEVTEGVIASGTEHWVTEFSQPAPAWRQPFIST